MALSANGRPASIEVAALFDAGRLSEIWERVILVDMAVAQELLGTLGSVDRIELVPRWDVDLEDLRARAAQLAPEGVTVAEPSRRRRLAEQMLASLRFNLLGLSAISVLVGGVLVATTLATSVVQRRYEISLLRSLGASRSQIASSVLTEAVGIGLIGGVVGVVLGFLGARAALASVRFTVASVVRGIPATEIQPDLWLALGGIALALATALAAAILPLVEAVAAPPLQGLRAAAPRRLATRGRLRTLALLLGMALTSAWLTSLPAWRDLPIAALLSALVVMMLLLAGSGLLLDTMARAGRVVISRVPAVAVRLASAAISAGRRRAAWAAGAVAVAVALAVAIATMVTSFRQTVEHWTDAGMRADVWVRPLSDSTGMWVGQLDPGVVGLAEELFGAEAVDPFYSVNIEYRGRPVAFGGAAFDVVQHSGSVPFPGRDSAEVFAEAYRRGAAVVNEPFATRFGVREGDTIRLDLPGGALEREVIGVFSDYSRSHGLIVVDRSDFLPHFPNRGPDDMALFLPPETDAELARKTLLEAARGRFLVEALVNRELRGAVLQAFERTFAITTAMYLVAAVVSVVAVATVLFTLVGERRRELATIRVVGGSRAQIVRMVVTEAGLLALAAAAAGAAAGLVVGVILVKVVNLQSFGWSLELVLPWSELVPLAAWVVAACLLAGLAPALAAARQHPAEVLREEG